MRATAVDALMSRMHRDLLMGHFVVPGEVIAQDGSSTMVGEGTQLRGDNIIAERRGQAELSGDVWCVRPAAEGPSDIKVGNIVYANVSRLNENFAMVNIIAVDGSLNSSLLPEQIDAEIGVADLVDRFMHEPRDAFRIRDIIRAEVTRAGPVIRLSMKRGGDLGVLHAQCPTCGIALEAGEWGRENNVRCPRCNHRGYRVLSDGFGYGTSMPKDVSKLSGLNGSGRWSQEIEAKRKANRVARGVLLRSDSQRDMYDPASRLFIGGLAPETEARDIVDLFSQCGQVVDAFVIRDRDTRVSKGYGFVTMGDAGMASQAARRLNRREVNGRNIAVRPAGEDRKKKGGRHGKDRRKGDQRGGRDEPRGGRDRKGQAKKEHDHGHRSKRELEAMLEEGKITKQEFNDALG